MQLDSPNTKICFRNILSCISENIRTNVPINFIAVEITMCKQDKWRVVQLPHAA